MHSLWRRQEIRLECTLRTDVAETEMPRPLSSPTIRLYPQCGFSLASRRIRSRSERSSGGRPGVRCGSVHRRAMSWRRDVAEPLYDRFAVALRDLGVRVETGVFGARMQVELVNDGPVTIVLDA
jgi:hypothetical protein